MSGVSIGSLIALPVLIQIWFNLLGGAYADRIGAKRTSLFAPCPWQSRRPFSRSRRASRACWQASS